MDLLRQYHDRILRSDPKAKTLSFPAGKLKARKAPDAWEINEEAFVPWARLHTLTEFYEVKTHINRTALKKAFEAGPGGQAVTAEGELVPGVTVHRGEDNGSWSVET